MVSETACFTAEAAASWIYKCQVTELTDLLNPAYVCDRTNRHGASYAFLYILISLFAMVSNSSVVLASIVERWKEIDQFTFVFAVSLSFNHFLVAFLVYPMTAYAMLKNNGWGLGDYWCTFTAYCTSYFEVLYMMHVLMILFDMLIYRFTSLKDVVKVFLVKKVAMSLWVAALIPHMLLMWQNSWFLVNGGTLGVKEKYVQCAAEGGEESVVINCFTAYTFNTYRELYIYLCCFWLLPVSYSICFYVALLYIRKRNLYKGNGKGQSNQLNNEETLEKSRKFVKRYKASVCMVLVFSVTQLPKWVTSFYLLYKDTQQKIARETAGFTETQYKVDMVIKMDFLSFWTCIGSVLIPVCYMMTCPTYFHAVTSTKPLVWLRKYGVKIHGRTYSQRLGSREREEVSSNGIPLYKLSGAIQADTESLTVYKNESCYEEDFANSTVLGNGSTAAQDHARPMSVDSVTVLVTPANASKNSLISNEVFSNGTEIESNCAKHEVVNSCETLNYPSQASNETPSHRRTSVLSLEEKVLAKRTLPTPRTPSISPLSLRLFRPAPP